MALRRAYSSSSRLAALVDPRKLPLEEIAASQNRSHPISKVTSVDRDVPHRAPDVCLGPDRDEILEPWARYQKLLSRPRPDPPHSNNGGFEDLYLLQLSPRTLAHTGQMMTTMDQPMAITVEEAKRQYLLCKFLVNRLCKYPAVFPLMK